MKLVEQSRAIPHAEIRKSPYFFRDTPSQEGLAALTESIRLEGQIHPVSVVRLSEPSVRGYQYELINGHRRFLATQQAGLATIRADIYEYTPVEVADEAERQSAIVRFLHDANLQEQLTPIELAERFVSMMESFDLSPEDIATMFHRTVEDVEDILKYAFIDSKVRDKVSVPENARLVTHEHLRLLADYAAPTKKGWRLNPEEQMQMVDKLLSGEDKRIQESPRLFTKEIRDLKQKVRAQKKEQNEQANPQPDQLLKALFKQVDKIERAVAELNTAQVPDQVGFVDRKALILRLTNVAQALVDFPDRLPAAPDPVVAEAV